MAVAHGQDTDASSAVSDEQAAGMLSSVYVLCCAAGQSAAKRRPMAAGKSSLLILPQVRSFSALPAPAMPQPENSHLMQYSAPKLNSGR